MVLGFNERRPTKEEYKQVQNILVNGLKELDIRGLVYLVYGSYARGNPRFNENLGDSDIDGILIFPDEYIINKDNFKRVKQVYQKATRDSTVPLKLSVMDMGVLRDGRFFTYEPQFRRQFLDESKLLVDGGWEKEDLVNEMNFIKYFDSKLLLAMWNLRSLRKDFLKFDFEEFDESYRRDYSYISFVKAFNNVLSQPGTLISKIPYWCCGEEYTSIRYGRGFEYMKQEFSHIDFSPAEKSFRLLHNFAELDNIYLNPKEMLYHWEASMTMYEQLVKEYCLRIEKTK